MPKSLLSVLCERLGLPDASRHRPLVLALIVDAVGTGLSGPLLLLYLIRVAGMSAGHAGLLLTVSGLASLAVPAVIGQLVDRWGARRLVILAQAIQAFAMAGFLLSPVFAAPEPMLVVSGLLSAVGQRAFWSSIFTVISDVAHRAEGGTIDSWFALSGMMQASGFAIGGLLAGALLLLPGALPFQIALAVNAVSFIVSTFLLIVEPDVNEPQHAHQPRRTAPRRHVLADPTYLALIVVNTLFAFCSTLLGIGLPVYVLNALHAPAWIVGPLLAVNTILCAAAQGLVVRRTQGWAKTVVLIIAGAVWTIWGLATAAVALIPAAVVIPALLATVLLYSIAELLHAPRSMSIASDAAPQAARGQYLSWFQYSFAIATLAAPAAFGLAFSAHPQLPWLITAGAAALGSMGMIVLARPLGERMALHERTATTPGGSQAS